MGERLAFAVEIPESLRGCRLPPMLLMTVIENAVEHGLEPQAEGGSVRLEARRSDDKLVVVVTDTGRGLGPGDRAKPGHGVGVANLRERLAALYGERARFTLEDVAPHGARATSRCRSKAVEVIAVKLDPQVNTSASHFTPAPTALIAEDEPMLRAMLKARLAEAWPELAIVAEAGNGAEALAQFAALPPGHRLSRHPDAGQERPRGRARDRRRVSRRVRDRL